MVSATVLFVTLLNKTTLQCYPKLMKMVMQCSIICIYILCCLICELDVIVHMNRLMEKGVTHKIIEYDLAINY